MIWTAMIADALLGVTLVVSPWLLLRLRRTRSDLTSSPAFVVGAVFIAACGLVLLARAGGLWSLDRVLSGGTELAAAAGAIALIGMLWHTLQALVRLPTHAQLERSTTAVQRTHEELDTFVASVSHDLRAPLTTIAGQAGLLEMSAGNRLDEDQRRRLHRIHQSIKQMSDLLEALLHLGRLSRHQLRYEVVDLSEVAATVVADLRGQEPHRTVEVVLPSSLTVQADRALITRVLTHLLTNAWRFTTSRPDARVEMGSRADDHDIVVFIRDNGVGFDQAQGEKIFRPFQRLHPELSGLGIGLATVTRIIQRHGGRVWCESAVNEGATFYFALPRCPPG